MKLSILDFFKLNIEQYYDILNSYMNLHTKDLKFINIYNNAKINNNYYLIRYLALRYGLFLGYINKNEEFIYNTQFLNNLLKNSGDNLLQYLIKNNKYSYFDFDNHFSIELITHLYELIIPNPKSSINFIDKKKIVLNYFISFDILYNLPATKSDPIILDETPITKNVTFTPTRINANTLAVTPITKNVTSTNANNIYETPINDIDETHMNINNIYENNIDETPMNINNIYENDIDMGDNIIDINYDDYSLDNIIFIDNRIELLNVNLKVYNSVESHSMIVKNNINDCYLEIEKLNNLKKYIIENDRKELILKQNTEYNKDLALHTNLINEQNNKIAKDKIMICLLNEFLNSNFENIDKLGNYSDEELRIYFFEKINDKIILRKLKSFLNTQKLIK